MMRPQVYVNHVLLGRTRIMKKFRSAHPAQQAHPHTTLGLHQGLCALVSWLLMLHYINTPMPYEPRCKKTGLRGFRPGPT